MWSDNPSERIIIRIFILGFLYFLHWLVSEPIKTLIAIPLMMCLILFSLEFIGGFFKTIFGINNDPEDNAGWGIWIIMFVGILVFFFYD